MPYLNWSEAEILPVQTGHPRLGTQLELTFSAEQALHLVESLQPVFAKAGSELRLDLPGRWTLYWKIREGDTRLLLAHPEADAWVGTVALNPEQAPGCLDKLRSLSVAGAEPFRLGDLPGVNRPSNFELVLKPR